MTPLVSICVPAFRHESTIEAALESALGQTLADIEVIVVDDCSDDATVERALGFSDTRLHVHRNPRNLGAIGNHNRCLSLACGTYVQFLHGDDLLLPTCVEVLAGILVRSPRSGFAFSERDVDVDISARPAFGDWARRHVDVRAHLLGPYELRRPVMEIDGRQALALYVAGGLRGNWFGEPTSVMLRSEALDDVGAFDPRLPQLFDVDLWWRMLCRWNAVYVKESLSVRRLHLEMLTAKNQVDPRPRLDYPWLAQHLLENAPRGVDTRRAARLRWRWLLAAAWRFARDEGALRRREWFAFATLAVRAAAMSPTVWLKRLPFPRVNGLSIED